MKKIFLVILLLFLIVFMLDGYEKKKDNKCISSSEICDGKDASYNDVTV